MNDAHLHLLVNHFPIIGTFFGFGILLTGINLKNNSVKNTAYILLIIAAVFTAFSMGTGEGAEKIVKKFPSVGKHTIHEHEEIAEKFALIMYLTGIMSFLSLFTSFKNHKLATSFSYITLVFTLLAAIVSKNVGTSGGEITHIEIRDNSENNSNTTATKFQNIKDED